MRDKKYLLMALLVGVLLVGATTAMAMYPVFPKIIGLPDGFRPEGIVSGYGTDFYAGSLANGAIYHGNLQTGEGELLVMGNDSGPAVGLAFDERTGYLFVSGGPSGAARVYNTHTGMLVGEYQLTTSAPTFVNDVVVTQGAAFFTDSFNPWLYKLPLAPNGAPLGGSEEVPLSGDWTQGSGFNANGIDATPNGDSLVVVNSLAGALFKVDPMSGFAEQIDLGGATVINGDGILLDGFTLYVLQNFQNQIAEIDLAPDLGSGAIVGFITDPFFDVPTTLTEFGNRLYAVNARFGTPPTPSTDYAVVQVFK